MTRGADHARSCDFCGLPLSPGRPRDGEGSPDGSPAFCCVGCSIAASVSGATGAEGHSRWMLARLGLGIFLTMNVMACTMVLWSQDVWAPSGEHGELQTALFGVFRYLGMLFSLPVLFLLGGPILENVLQTARRGAITTDWLILLGVAAAFVYSAISTFRGTGHVYFEIGCMVLVFVTLGRWLEAVGKLKTGEALDALTRLLPDRVRRLIGDQQEEIARKSAAAGDLLRVLAGERFAVDGRIIRGTADIDEQILSGESAAVSKTAGDAVFSGTLNVDGDLTIEVTAPAGQETVSRLIELVRRSREQAGAYQRLADRVAWWFVPAVGLLAVAVAAWHGMTSGFEQGVLAGLAVVLIACPCALGLATPLAIWTGMGRAARRQVLFRSAEALERLARVTTVRLDKTGTLTTGEASVESLSVDPETPREDLLAVAGAMAAASNHTFSTTIRDFAAAERGSPDPAQDVDRRSPGATLSDDSGRPAVGPWAGSGDPRPARAPLSFAHSVQTISGRGLIAENAVGRDTVYLGNLRHMETAGQRLERPLDDQSEATIARGQSIVLVGWGGRVRGLFALGESLRPEAHDAVAALLAEGLDVSVLTGDHQSRADRIAAALGVPVLAEQLPEDKVAEVTSARGNARVVAMVGDGINDAPALAAADVGVAMGCGADLSRDAADVCLLTDDLRRLPWAIRFSRVVLRTIRQNLFWAFAYNVVGIGIASTGGLNPILAAVAMTLSSLFVVTNSLRLGRSDEDE